MGKITIQKMAEELGLSRNTVSMALKGNELVTARTRELVLRYARQVGYLAAPAQGETAGKEGGEADIPRPEIPGEETSVHHIMILRKPDVAVYWDKVINGISEEASASRCKTQVAVVTREDERELRLPPGLTEEIEAVFCVKMMNRDYIRKVREKGIQVFLLDTYKDSGGEMPGDIVKTESFQPVAELTRHLIAQGMRRIGFLNDGSSVYETMHDRYDGYLYAMRSAGLEPAEEYVLPDVREKEVYNAETFEKIVDGYRVLPEAVVCGNDELAKFLTQAFRRRGIRVPEDVAVTGFDNDEEGMLDPFFTTVHVDAKWLGRRMVQCFLWRTAHPQAPYEKIAVTGKVIIRRSSCR